MNLLIYDKEENLKHFQDTFMPYLCVLITYKLTILVLLMTV
ncbi:hypothetical protein [Clostridium sp.]